MCLKTNHHFCQQFSVKVSNVLTNTHLHCAVVSSNTKNEITEDEIDSVEDIFSNIFPTKYDKNTRPMIKNSTFNINVALYVFDLTREINSDYLVSFCFISIFKFFKKFF